MPPKAKAQLAREHLERALPAVDAEDATEAVMWLFAALEAAITAIAEAHGGRRRDRRAARGGVTHMSDEARRLVPPRLRSAHDALRERARESGAQALILTGSTARRARTVLSDLDYHLVGEPLRMDDMPGEIDVHAVSPARLRERLFEGDDFAHWSLRLGVVVFDRGIVSDCVRLLDERALWPDAARKAEQAHKSLEMATAMVHSGDLDAATDQVRTALTVTARWRLLASGVFPLSRSELPDQLRQLGVAPLASALAATIVDGPTLEQLDDSIATASDLLDAHRVRTPA